MKVFSQFCFVLLRTICYILPYGNFKVTFDECCDVIDGALKLYPFVLVSYNLVIKCIFYIIYVFYVCLILTELLIIYVTEAFSRIARESL